VWQSEDDEDGAHVESRDSEVRKAKIQSSVTGKDEKCEKWITEAESVGEGTAGRHETGYGCSRSIVHKL